MPDSGLQVGEHFARQGTAAQKFGVYPAELLPLRVCRGPGMPGDDFEAELNAVGLACENNHVLALFDGSPPRPVRRDCRFSYIGTSRDKYQLASLNSSAQSLVQLGNPGADHAVATPGRLGPVVVVVQDVHGLSTHVTLGSGLKVQPALHLSELGQSVLAGSGVALDPLLVLLGPALENLHGPGQSLPGHPLGGQLPELLHVVPEHAGIGREGQQRRVVLLVLQRGARRLLAQEVAHGRLGQHQARGLQEPLRHGEHQALLRIREVLGRELAKCNLQKLLVPVAPRAGKDAGQECFSVVYGVDASAPFLRCFLQRTTVRDETPSFSAAWAADSRVMISAYSQACSASALNPGPGPAPWNPR